MYLPRRGRYRPPPEVACSSTSRRMASRSVLARPKVLPLRSGAVRRAADTGWFLSDLYGRAGAEWCGDLCRRRVDELRSSDEANGDRRVSVYLLACRLDDTRAKPFSYRS